MINQVYNFKLNENTYSMVEFSNCQRDLIAEDVLDPSINWVHDNFKGNQDIKMESKVANSKDNLQLLCMETYEQKYSFIRKDDNICDYQFGNQEDYWKCDQEWDLGGSNMITDKIESNNQILLENNLVPNFAFEVRSKRTPIFNKSGTLRKKIGRKPENTGLHQRKDVVLKHLLRKIKYYYWDQLKTVTKYLKQKKRRGIQYYERCLEIFIESELDEEVSSDFVLILGSITSLKDMKELITHKMNSSSETDNRLLRRNLNLVDKIYCTLYKFSFSKFSGLARYPAMHHLLIHFSNKNLNLLSDDERIGLRIFINECKKYEDLNNSF